MLSPVCSSRSSSLLVGSSYYLSHCVARVTICAWESWLLWLAVPQVSASVLHHFEFTFRQCHWSTVLQQRFSVPDVSLDINTYRMNAVRKSSGQLLRHNSHFPNYLNRFIFIFLCFLSLLVFFAICAYALMKNSTFPLQADKPNAPEWLFGSIVASAGVILCSLTMAVSWSDGQMRI